MQFTNFTDDIIYIIMNMLSTDSFFKMRETNKHLCSIIDNIERNTPRAIIFTDSQIKKTLLNFLEHKSDNDLNIRVLKYNVTKSDAKFYSPKIFIDNKSKSIISNIEDPGLKAFSGIVSQIWINQNKFESGGIYPGLSICLLKLYNHYWNDDTEYINKKLICILNNYNEDFKSNVLIFPNNEDTNNDNHMRAILAYDNNIHDDYYRNLSKYESFIYYEILSLIE